MSYWAEPSVNKKILLIAAACGAVFSLGATAAPQEQTLANGFKIVVERDTRSPVVVSQLWYRIGSVDEVNGHTGLSHLLEHMMFKGTPTVPDGEYSRRIAQAGGKENAFTSRDYTVYFQQLAAKHLPLAMKLEADRRRNLSFSDDAFRRELEVVKEERRWRTDDKPTGVLFEALYANAFMANPVRYPVIGWMDDLDHTKPDDARQWYRQWYAPNNATLVVVGDVEPQAVFAEAQKQFGGLPAVALPERRPQQEPEQKGIRRVSVKAPSRLGFVAMAWQAPRLSRIDLADPYGYFMLAEVLSGDSAGRLPRTLVREQSIAQSASANYDALGRGGALFTIIASRAADKTDTALEAAIRAQVARIAKDGIGEQELERVRLQMDAERIYQRDSMFAQAMEIGTLESVGFSWRDQDTMRQRLRAVTPAEVQKAAAALIDDRLTVVTLTPQPVSRDTQNDIKGESFVR